MDFSKLFPKFPVCACFRRRDKASKKIRIRPSRPYVDLPGKIYSFTLSLAMEIIEEKISTDEFKRKWKDFVTKEKDISLNGRPIACLLLKDSPDRKTISLRVNWNTFFEYLERRSEEYITKIKKDGKIIREAYNEIWSNFFISTDYRILFPKIREDDFQQFYGRAFENFRKILIYTSDYDEIQHFFKQLLKIVDRLENIFYNQKAKSSILFTSQVKMDIFGLFSAFEILSIPACYFYLRNILEFLIKLILYEKIAENFGKDREIILLLLFEAERIKEGGKRIYSPNDLRRWKTEVNKALSRILSASEEERERKIQILEDKIPGLTRKSIEVICKEHGLKGDLKNLWIACSEIIHNQPPLPFYSLFEVKIFKQFLKYYVEEIKKALSTYIPLADISSEYHEPKRLPSVRRLKTIYDTLFEKRKEIERLLSEIIQKYEKEGEIWFDPLTLSSLLLLWSPFSTRLYKHYLTEDDLDRVIEKVKPLSFHIGLDLKKKETFEIFYRELIPKLDKISREFSNLNEEEKRIIVFWILATFLPDFIKKSWKVRKRT